MTSFKRTFETEIGGGFFNLRFKMADGVDGGGNADNPVELTLYACQMEEVEQDYTGSSAVTLKFCGPLEFREFHYALSELVEQLTQVYGAPSKEGTSA